MDNKTEENLKRMLEDYKYETTGVPQRLEHSISEGIQRGLERAEEMQRIRENSMNNMYYETLENFANVSYKGLKELYIDYNNQVMEIAKTNRKAIKKYRINTIVILIITILVACGTLASTTTVSSDISMVVFGCGLVAAFLLGCVSLGRIINCFMTPLSSAEFALNNSIECGCRQACKDLILEKHSEEYENDNSFNFEESELEEAIREDKKNKTSRIILAIIPIIILIGVIFSISLNSIYLKANNSKANIETNSSIANKENEQENTKIKNYIAENGKEFNINALELDNITEQIESSSNLNNRETENPSTINQNTNNNNNNNNTNNNTSTNTDNNNNNTNTTLEQIKLPNLVNLTEAEAINKLKSLGLEYSITRNTKQVAFDNPNAGKSIVTNIIDKKDYYSQYDRVYLEVNQYQESGISIGFIINTKELVNHVKVYVDNKEYSAYYFPNMSSETFYAKGRKHVNIKIVLNNYSENIEIYNKNINLYEANKTVSDDGYTYIDIGTIDYKP